MMNQQSIELHIQGMTCASCSRHVTQALEHVQGVEKVTIPGWESNQAIVLAETSTDVSQLIQAVKDAGYSASIVSQTLQTTAFDEKIAHQSFDFDLLVIGGGSGGFAAAIKASELGKRVGIINAGLIGGTCVNVGCIPSKALIRGAEIWHKAGFHGFKGINTTQTGLDWATIRTEKDSLVARLRQSKYLDILAAYSNIRLIEGFASFRETGGVQVGEHVYTAHRYIIATGSKPRQLALEGLEEVHPLTSTSLMDLEELPESLIVLGGRAVALELGQVMARLGVKVLILQRSTRLIPDHEPEISRAMQEYLEDEGIGVISGVQVQYFSRKGTRKIVHGRVMGQNRQFQADQILMAVGREPNTLGLGLEKIGVKTNEQGFIIIDEYQQTSHPSIFAVGDVTTQPELVYVAAAGGSIASHNAFSNIPKPLDLSVLPTVIFTDPQIASVGLTEQTARRSGYEVKTSVISLDHLARAQTAHDTRGLIKLVVEANSGRILGAHVLAVEGGEVIQTASLAIKAGITAHDLADTLFPYLTQVEGLKLAALALEKDIALLSCCAV